MRLIFTRRSWEDYLSWQEGDKVKLRRLNRLIDECVRTPYAGTGKPEPLKQELRGWWSRRIDREHRLVYRVIGRGDEQGLEIAQCRSHY